MGITETFTVWGTITDMTYFMLSIIYLSFHHVYVMTKAKKADFIALSINRLCLLLR